MTTRSTILLKQPRESIRTALVERTWELAALIDEIEHAQLIGEVQLKHGLYVAKHSWRAEPNVPDLLTPHIDADAFSWIATVEWQEGEFTSQWRVEPLGLKEDISCTAQLSLNDSMGGRATKIAINLKIHGLDNHRGVEEIANRIVLVNWQKLIEATNLYIEKKG